MKSTPDLNSIKKNQALSKFNNTSKIILKDVLNASNKGSKLSSRYQSPSTSFQKKENSRNTFTQSKGSQSFSKSGFNISKGSIASAHSYFQS
jgi:hypothetical protein